MWRPAAARLQRAVLLLAGLVVLLGCAVQRSGAPVPQGAGHIVAGEIRLETPLKDVFVYARGRAAVGRDVGVRRWVYPDGSFIFTGMPKGDYYIAGFADHAHTYWVEYESADLTRATVAVGDEEVAFLGVHEVRHLKSKRFDFVRLRGDGERAALERLATEAEGADWLPAVRRRIAKLN